MLAVLWVVVRPHNTANQMNEEARQQLQFVLSRYGRGICHDHRRVEALLRDLCAARKREISVLMVALRAGIPNELIANPGNNGPGSPLLNQCAGLLYDEWGIEEKFAHWSVESWSLALAKAPVLNETEMSSGPLDDLRVALRDNQHTKAFALLKQHPNLEKELLADEFIALKQAWFVATNWIENLRSALLEGAEVEVLRLAGLPDAPLHGLRAGEQAQLDWIKAKHSALPQLRQAIHDKSGDFSADYWSALGAGIRIPAALKQKARARLLQESESRHHKTIAALPLFNSAVPSVDTLDELEQATGDEIPLTSQLAERFAQALAQGNDVAIAAVAHEYAQYGITLPRTNFEQYLNAHRRHKTLIGLRAALSTRDTAKAARLWAYAHAHWPTFIDPADDMAGSIAFRTWGASFQRKTSGV